MQRPNIKRVFSFFTLPSFAGGTVASLLSLGAAVWLGNLNSARADVRLPSIFSDGMVLQQNASVPVWGWADVGEEITVA